MGIFGKKGAKGEKVKIWVVKIGEKSKDVTVPIGTTVEECFTKAGIDFSKDGDFQLRKIVNLEGKPKTYNAKWGDKIKGTCNFFYAPKVKGGR